MSRNFELMQKAQERGEAFSDIEGTELLTIPSLETRPTRRHWLGGIYTQPLGERTAADVEILNLVNNVFLAPERVPGLEGTGQAARLVVFSEMEASGSSSDICARAAEILAAHVRNRVCLVDANICSPSFHERYGLGNAAGLLNTLAHPEPIGAFLHQVGDSNLWLMPCGSTHDSSKELDFAHWPARVAELRREFDFVLMNAPAIDAHSAVLLLGQLADGLVLVIEANITRRDTAQKVKQDLELAGICLLGAILNNRTFPVPDSLYRYLRTTAGF